MRRKLASRTKNYTQRVIVVGLPYKTSAPPQRDESARRKMCVALPAASVGRAGWP